MTVPAAITDAITRLWSNQPPLERLSGDPFFRALVIAYRETYPAAGSGQILEYSLRGALSRLGLGVHSLMAPEEAAARLHAAASATTSSRVHLCPLDWAGLIPTLKFGPNAVQRFSTSELEGLLLRASASPFDALRGLDIDALARFRWLVVRETTPIAPQPGMRSLPALWINSNEDFGRIEPHHSRFPSAVRRALFCLLAIPWEHLTREHGTDWRPFNVPWVHTVDDDLFAKPALPPNAASLTWVTHYQDLGHGNVDEVEMPLAITLDDDADDSAMNSLDDQAWQRFQTAEASPLLTSPIIHFFNTGLLADGIDEFLAHVTTIEACLGEYADHARHPPLPDGSNGATARTAWRLGVLLDDPSASSTFRSLFKLRSRYVHGEPMTTIGSTTRTSARALARRCITQLVKIAAEEVWSDRRAWLASMIPK